MKTLKKSSRLKNLVLEYVLVINDQSANTVRNLYHIDIKSQFLSITGTLRFVQELKTECSFICSHHELPFSSLVKPGGGPASRKLLPLNPIVWSLTTRTICVLGERRWPMAVVRCPLTVDRCPLCVDRNSSEVE